MADPETDYQASKHVMLNKLRNEAIASLDESLRRVRSYVERHGEPSRLVGVVPDLEAVRVHFERGTDPDGD
jgi:hypothetical protein